VCVSLSCSLLRAIYLSFSLSLSLSLSLTLTLSLPLLLCRSRREYSQRRIKPGLHCPVLIGLSAYSRNSLLVTRALNEGMISDSDRRTGDSSGIWHAYGQIFFLAKHFSDAPMRAKMHLATKCHSVSLSLSLALSFYFSSQE